MSAPPHPTPRTVGRYVLRHPLPAMGCPCFSADDPQLGRSVAIHWLEGEAGSAFESAKGRAGLSHPHLAAVHDVGRVAEGAFVAMDLPPTRSLRQWLSQAPRRAAEVRAVFREAASALAALHQAGRAHGAVSAEAIRVDDQERTFLVDCPFVPARNVADDVSRFHRLLSETCPGYRAPAAAQPSMAELTRALAPVKRRRVQVASVLLAAVSVVVTGLLLRSKAQEGACAKRVEAVTSAWDGLRREQLLRNFRGVEPVLGERTGQEVARVLDSYAQRWSAVATRFCGMPASDSRPTCLQRRLQELSALTALLDRADAETVRGAINASHNLPRPESCEQVRADTPQTAPEDGPALEHLAKAKALTSAGRQRDALTSARAATDAARSLALKAEALTLTGQIQGQLADFEGGTQTLRQAIYAGQASGEDLSVSRAYAWLIMYAAQLGHFEEAHRNVEQARAWTTKLGSTFELLATLASFEGNLAQAERRFDDAYAYHQRALAERLPHYGRRHPLVAMSMSLSCHALANGGKFEKARACYEEVLALRTELFGERHTAVATTRASLASLQLELHELDGAVENARRAIEDLEQSLGKDAPPVGFPLETLASAYLQQHRANLALPLYIRAVSMIERSNGADNPLLISFLNGQARSLLELGRERDAEPLLVRALALAAKPSADPEQAKDARELLKRVRNRRSKDA